VPSALVGREGELAILRAHLDAALSGQGGLVLIGGEAGIGKTALAETLCREATERAALVLVGHCYDLTDTPPYGPWVDLFATYTPGTDLPLLPAPFATRGTVGAVASQAALFAAVQDFFTALAEQSPLLIFLDDLHWADPASLTLLRFLARALMRLPLLVLVAYRADELTRRHPLYTTLPLLEHESAASRLDLRRLSAEAVHTLVTDRYPLLDADRERLVAYLLHRAEGNAFFTLQLLRALAEGDALRPGDGGWVVGDLERIHVPLALRQVIDARLLRLPEEAQRLLAVAAVIGQEVPLTLWATVSERDEDALLEVVEPASVARIVEEAEDGTRVRFVHALIRETLYEGTLATRRRRLHRRVGEALMSARDADPDAVAYHFDQAGDARALQWLVAAGDRADGLYAYLTAVARHERALARLDDVGDAAVGGWIRIRLGLLYRHATPGRGLAHLESAQPYVVSSGDPVLAAYWRAARGLVRCWTGRGRAGLADLEVGVAAIGALPDQSHLADELPACIRIALEMGG
jgi:predicted ATPase